MKIRSSIPAATILLPLFLFFNLSACSDQTHEHHHIMGEAEHRIGNEDMDKGEVGICPVMHNKASKEYPYVYKGKTYYFCCPVCIEKFKNDPAKYISKIKEINLEAFRFGFSPDRITVKKGDIVQIYATSRDVTHGFYIKEYNINVPLEKGKVKKIEFLADKAGEFDIICSVYCGRGHDKMKARLIVEE